MKRHLLTVLFAIGWSLAIGGPSVADEQLRAQITSQASRVGIDESLLQTASDEQVAQIELALNTSDNREEKRLSILRIVAAK